MQGEPVILFDGACGLCSRAVRFVLQHERAPWCKFAAIQSASGQALVRAAGRDPSTLDTLYMWTGGALLDRSEAALAIARQLRAPWRWLTVFHVLPIPLRDALYNAIARRRYAWFGRHEVCELPPGLDRARFLT